MSNGPWTDEENDLIVADYFAMLADDIAGHRYNKAEHRRALMPLLEDRSEGSVEFKHQNISAVLKGLGEDWIPGYKPAFNFQMTLVDAVARWLALNPAWLGRRSAARPPSGLADAAPIWIGPPPTLTQLRACESSARELEGEIRTWHRDHEASRRLATIPGLGEITASAIAATVPDASFFRSGREFAAWLGLTPRQNSSGGKDRLGRTTKQGNRHIRSLLVIGATSLLRYWRGKLGDEAAWVNRLLERRPPRLVTVALANKLARIVWAVLVRGETYRRPSAAAA